MYMRCIEASVVVRACLCAFLLCHVPLRFQDKMCNVEKNVWYQAGEWNKMQQFCSIYAWLKSGKVRHFNVEWVDRNKCFRYCVALQLNWPCQTWPWILVHTPAGWWRCPGPDPRRQRISQCEGSSVRNTLNYECRTSDPLTSPRCTHAAHTVRSRVGYENQGLYTCTSA